MRVFLWECRRVLASVPYWLFVAVLVLFLYSQSALPITEGQSAFVRPQPGDEQSRFVPSYDPALIMPDAAAQLRGAWEINFFITYPPPLGLYRHVTLNSRKHAELGSLLEQLYGSDGALRATLTWEEFVAVMQKADRLLGGGSNWEVSGLERRYGQVPAQYADLLAEYEACRENDRYTGAYARLFCDYAVIALALFGALPAVALFLQDYARRGSVTPVLWVRRCSSFTVVAARCGALVFLQFVPVLVLDGWLTAYYTEIHGAESIDAGAFLWYSLLWLLPTLCVTVCAGALLTLATGRAIGAGLLPAAGWLSVMAGAQGGLSTGSSYGSLLTPRHNAVGKYLVFRQNLPALLAGRGRAMLLAALCLALAVFILHRERRGHAL